MVKLSKKIILLNLNIKNYLILIYLVNLSF